MKKLILIVYLIFVSSSAAMAEDLKPSEIEKLFPSYISTLLERHDLVITGQEREAMNDIISSLDQHRLGKNDVFTPEYIHRHAEKLSDMRREEIHKAQLANELEQIFSLFKNDPESLKCTYTKPEQPSYNKGSVACKLETKLVEGCAYLGRISLQVDTTTKRGAGVYRSPVIINDEQYSPYSFGINCPN
ncbi:MAG TPA: hypothetical protein PKW15_01705 [Alphaproteobacteria bacterium]|nr:hypothetical protein [Rhodospirillaceae bacterium]HRJ11940.1 hypothetical protein [Alphaproteobacteria bacterium]